MLIDIPAQLTLLAVTHRLYCLVLVQDISSATHDGLLKMLMATHKRGSKLDKKDRQGQHCYGTQR